VAEEYRTLHRELRGLGDRVDVPAESLERIKDAVRRTLSDSP